MKKNLILGGMTLNKWIQPSASPFFPLVFKVFPGISALQGLPLHRGMLYLREVKGDSAWWPWPAAMLSFTATFP